MKPWPLGLSRADTLALVLLLLLSAVTMFEVRQRSHGYELGRRPHLRVDALVGGGHVAGEDSLGGTETVPLPLGERKEEDTELEEQGDEEQQEDGLTELRDKCHAEEHTEYGGEVVVWGTDHFTPTSDACCDACAKHSGCHVWVWCGMLSGCGPERVPLPTGSLGTMGTRKYRECWLKNARLGEVLREEGFPNPDVGWISGSVFEQRGLTEFAERQRLQALRDNPALPLVYLDISIKGLYVGRIEIVLFKDAAPLAAENFRVLCTGELGVVPDGHEGAGLTYSFKGRAFYRIIDRFIDQTGANTESIYGGSFKDEPGGLAIKHDRRGLLSMANAGPDSNTSHWSILMGPAPHLDGKYVVFGEVVSGMEVALKINALARGKPGNSAGLDAQAVIIGCGELHR